MVKSSTVGGGNASTELRHLSDTITKGKLWEGKPIQEQLFYINITEQIKGVIKRAKKISSQVLHAVFLCCSVKRSDLIHVRRKWHYRCLTLNKRTVRGNCSPQSDRRHCSFMTRKTPPIIHL